MMLANKIKSVLHLVVLSALFFMLSVVPVYADGGYVWTTEFVGKAKSGGQQAVMLFFDNVETLLLQTNYEGELAAFSWLIPVPAPVTAEDVREADSELFSELDELTAPTFYEQHYDGSSCNFLPGGAGGGSGSDGSTIGKNKVTVLDTILTEKYEINVLTALDAPGIMTWLNQNQYTVPDGGESIFQDYISRGWYFLAVRINPSNTEGDIKQATAPLQISFKIDKPVFPLLISSLSSEAETEVLIHMISDHRYKTTNVQSMEVGFYKDVSRRSYQETYTQWMREKVSGYDGQLYLVEYADWLAPETCNATNSHLGDALINCENEIFITRFRSYFSPDQFTEDIYFEQDIMDDPFRVKIYTTAYTLVHSSLFLTNILFLFMTFTPPGRRLNNSSRRRLRLAAVVILCLLMLS